MKASEFIKKVKNIANNYKTLYVMGCFGSPMNVANKKRYTTNNSYNKQASRTKMINNATADTFGFDCVCLLKAIFWEFNGDKSKTYGGAKYASNGVPDVNANQMFNSYCKSKSKNFKNIIPGEFLWMNGHIGVYIGNGLGIECTPAFKNKVQITAVGNIGAKSGYPTRNWTSHGKCVFIDYDVKDSNTTSSPNSTNKSSSSTKYYPKYTGTTTSIVNALVSLKIDSSFSNRTKIANKNGISNYKGTASQNIQLLNLLRQGKLIKP